MKNFISKITNKANFSSKSHRGFFVMFLITGLITVIIEYSRSDIKEKSHVASPSTDTYIPKGFVLVPIEVQNSEVLNSILGPFGVVDLFLAPLIPGKKPQLVASGVRILRAPLNPQKFAILSPESQAPKLVQQSRSFFVVIQNPNQKKMQFSKIREKKRRIFVESI